MQDTQDHLAAHHQAIKAMLGMLGGGENMSENLNIYLWNINACKGMGEGGGGGGSRQNLSQSEVGGFHC